MQAKHITRKYAERHKQIRGVTPVISTRRRCCCRENNMEWS